MYGGLIAAVLRKVDEHGAHRHLRDDHGRCGRVGSVHAAPRAGRLRLILVEPLDGGELRLRGVLLRGSLYRIGRGVHSHFQRHRDLHAHL